MVKNENSIRSGINPDLVRARYEAISRLELTKNTGIEVKDFRIEPWGSWGFYMIYIDLGNKSAWIRTHIPTDSCDAEYVLQSLFEIARNETVHLSKLEDGKTYSMIAGWRKGSAPES